MWHLSKSASLWLGETMWQLNKRLTKNHLVARLVNIDERPLGDYRCKSWEHFHLCYLPNTLKHFVVVVLHNWWLIDTNQQPKDAAWLHGAPVATTLVNPNMKTGNNLANLWCDSHDVPKVFFGINSQHWLWSPSIHHFLDIEHQWRYSELERVQLPSMECHTSCNPKRHQYVLIVPKKLHLGWLIVITKFCVHVTLPDL